MSLNLRSWKVVLHLAVHAIVGMVLFCIVAVPALLLGELVKYLANWGASAYVLWVLTAAEYVVFTADALLYLFLFLKSLYKAAKELDL